MAPIVVGSNNEFVGIALISACVVILLFYFDPVFKYYKSNLPKFDKYCKVSFSLGLLIAVISNLLPSYSGIFLAVWGIPVFIYGFVFCRVIDQIVQK